MQQKAPCVFYHLRSPITRNYQCYVPLTEKRAAAPKNTQCFLPLTDIVSRNYLYFHPLTKKGGGRRAGTPVEPTLLSAGLDLICMGLGREMSEKKPTGVSALLVGFLCFALFFVWLADVRMQKNQPTRVSALLTLYHDLL
jgi:hypothetical protein